MIHEAMILDVGGPDLALMQYAAALKLWMFASFLATALLPAGCFAGLSGVPVYFCTVFLIAGAVGCVESVMARFRFRKVPQMLLAALGLVLIAMVLLLVFEGGEV